MPARGEAFPDPAAAEGTDGKKIAGLRGVRDEIRARLVPHPPAHR